MAESWASSDHARRSMQGNRSRDTAPELAVRRLVHAMGLRYRVNARPLPTVRRTADLVFTRRRVAVFIDGCYWHGCPDHHRQPSANADYWRAKVARNRARDAATDETLRAAGWTVLRFWEHQPPAEVAEAVRAAVTGAMGRA
ncbi:very short patch repair endonuclease [Mycobacterium avium]|uniref:very short patch repair endonuclease n=1 Tax=Mycobacterium avium TaxID=1764 RepID=UPI000A073148|nr:very short patch repair endonuclease [Mycobacterium avium]MDV3291908.1 very short patch repair endonuclease [Mycobacterium avium subsp. hominissuis]TXA41424.1 very short patch repair endonuclease [Mycobacterium tuberculosis variant bovis]